MRCPQRVTLGCVSGLLFYCTLILSSAASATVVKRASQEPARRSSAHRRSQFSVSAVENSAAKGHVIQSTFRFPDKHFRQQSALRQPASFLQASNTCTLPKGLKLRSPSVGSPTLVNLLKTHKPFTYVRFGDGDWYCALGGTGLDSNGVVLEKSTDMCTTLQSDIKNYGLMPDTNFFAVVGSFFICKEKSLDMFSHVDGFFATYPSRADFSGFLDSNVVGFYFPLLPPVQHRRAPGVLPLLVDQVVVLVGPKHLGTLNLMLNFTAHVEVPLQTCWENRDQLILKMMQESQRHPRETVVFLVAGGIAARTMLYQTFLALGQKDTFIDVGSSLDGFAGVASRDYNKNISQLCMDYPEYAAHGTCPNQASIKAVRPSVMSAYSGKGAEGAHHDEDDDGDEEEEDDPRAIRSRHKSTLRRSLHMKAEHSKIHAKPETANTWFQPLPGVIDGIVKTMAAAIFTVVPWGPAATALLSRAGLHWLA